MANSDKEYELQLLKSNDLIAVLEMEIEDLKASLHLVNEKLQESEKFKGHFISNVTNEIINPFASIMALSENIQNYSGKDISKISKMADLIHSEAFHLDFQLKNIFAAALIEAGKEELKVSSVDLDELSDEVVEYFNRELLKKNIQIVLQTNIKNVDGNPIPFFSDEDKLDLIIKNLVSNSIKYSPKGSSVALILSVDNKLLTLEISDKGKGINAKDRAVIFDRFKQLDEKINSINTGHGLGLSVVLAYTDLLNGEVNITDNIDGGMRVIITIPESSDTQDWDDLDRFIIDSDLTI